MRKPRMDTNHHEFGVTGADLRRCTKMNPDGRSLFSNGWKLFYPIFQSLEISEVFFPGIGKDADSYHSCKKQDGFTEHTE